MGQRAVSDREVIETVWQAEDRLRLGASCLATRKLPPKGELSLVRFKLAGAFVWVLIARRWSPYGGGWIREGEDVYEFDDGDAAWRAAIGWDGKGEPEGLARYRRRA